MIGRRHSAYMPYLNNDYLISKIFSLMTKLINITRRFLPVALMAAASTAAVAQGYNYDDDIYYDASKKKAEKSEAAKTRTQATTARTASYSGVRAATDYPAADTYNAPVSSLDVDVDTYNRRGQFLVSDSVDTSAQTDGDFTYTQRIERFHNPDVVSGSSDEELKGVYAYAMQQPQNINVYVIDNDPWSWYGPSWSWRYGNPWYWNTWGPSWSLSWGIYDPYWAWGPSWGWSWGWGPAWGPAWGPSWGWGPGWGGPVHAWHPSTPSGSSRPHRPVGAGAVATHRPGAYSPSGAAGNQTGRPGNMGRYGSAGRTGNTGTRPGNYVPSSDRNNGSSSVRPATGSRGRSAMTPSNNTPSTTGRNSYNSNSNNGYRQSSGNSGASYRQSGSSGFSRGSSGSHGYSGGASRGSGGGGRGRR